MSQHSRAKGKKTFYRSLSKRTDRSARRADELKRADRDKAASYWKRPKVK